LEKLLIYISEFLVRLIDFTVKNLFIINMVDLAIMISIFGDLTEIFLFN